jgi:DNA (cytosine-5)-methyltransferase 1
MDIGFIQAKFEVVWANDLMPDACATYKRNIGDHIVQEDIREVDLSVLPNCDVVIGGPPCQGYSVAGHMNPADPRSSLTWEFVRVVGAIRPKAFVMENVKALAVSRRWQGVRSRLVAGLEALGYTVVTHVLDARHYGVPQGRERAFFIGTLDELPPVRVIPRGTGEPRSAGDFLRALPKPGVKPNLGVCKAKVVPAKKPVLRESPFAGMLFNGQGRPIDLSSTANTLPASMGGNRTPIVDEDELRYHDAPWVVQYHARLMSELPPLGKAPARLRRITVTEAARLQMFPVVFTFEGRQNSQYTQIGNAVPPPLAKAVAGSLLQSLNGIEPDGQAAAG